VRKCSAVAAGVGIQVGLCVNLAVQCDYFRLDVAKRGELPHRGAISKVKIGLRGDLKRSWPVGLSSRPRLQVRKW